jgi:membrane protein YqaA with SNARE-associated domain
VGAALANLATLFGVRAGGNRRALRLLAALGGLALLIGVNALIFVLPIDYRRLGMLAYPGVFVLTFIANATTFVPVPYIPMVMHVSRMVELVPLVVLLGALGSVLGESVAFAAGKAGEGLAEESKLWRRLEGWFARPVRAWLALFVLAVPLNPLFDVAGIAAGALGVSYRIFFTSVLLARVIRMAVIAWIAISFR